ncbi:MAG: bromodomain-containing 7-like [Trebouxia sp. A1-2]|nr:MAG: bromodomain-containing 7-like [Trebouxia sp. A1-2]
MPEGVSGGQAVQNVPKQTDASAAQEQHFQTLEQVISFFEKQDPEGFFGAPVTEDVAPNYFNIIKHPMSCQRMRQKLRALEYRTFAAFVEDFELIGNNAMRYNQKRSRVHRSAVNLLRHGKKHLNNVQLEATRAIHLLHPEGPVAAAQEEAAASRAANAVPLAPSTSNLNKLLPSLTMPHHSSKQLQRGVSGLDISMPMALQDLQADYFSDEDPAYSSFSDTDLEDSDIEPSTAPFSPHTAHEPVVAESWGPAAHPQATTSALPSDSNQPQQPSSTMWQTHWLELRIHALRQQQQRYESKLQRLRQQGQQSAESAPSPLPLHPQHPGGSALTSSHQPDAAPTAQDSQAAANSSFPQSVDTDQVTMLSPSQPPSADMFHLHPGAAATFPAALHQQAGGEPRRKRRHARQQIPGLSMPEIARHPFFSQHGSAEPASSAQQLAPEGEGRDDCYPARAHATLDLLDRHLATMKDQLTPNPSWAGHPPRKWLVEGWRGKAKAGRARGLFAPPAKQVLDRSDSKLGKRRRTADYDFGDVIMPPLPGAKAAAQLPKVCITVPGVRPLPEEELDRRTRAVELIRCGTSGGAQRSARAKQSKPPKPPVRMDSIPPPEAKLLNVAAAVLPPSSASVAMDPAAVIGAAAVSAAVSDAVVTSITAAGQEQMQLPTNDVEMADRSQMGADNILKDRSAANGKASPKNIEVMQDDKRSDALPQLGLTLSSNHVQADDPRPLSRIHSMASTKNGRKSSTPRGSTPRAGTGRPPRGGSGNMARQESNTADRKDSRKLMRRNTTG